MYGEDIEAMRNFQAPGLLLEVCNDHLEVREISFIGRIIRWIASRYIPTSWPNPYRNTSLDKITEYLANNISDWAITQHGYSPIKRLVKRIRKANRINPKRFPEHVNKIEQYFKLVTPNPIRLSIHQMTNAEVMENLEGITIGEFNELPYRRVWEIFIKPMRIPGRLIALLAPDESEEIRHFIAEEVVEEEKIPTPRENVEAVAISIAADMREYFKEEEKMQGSFSDPLASSVISDEPPQSHKDDHENHVFL